MDLFRKTLLSHAGSPRLFDFRTDSVISSPLHVNLDIGPDETDVLQVVRSFSAQCATQCGSALRAYLLLSLARNYRTRYSHDVALTRCAAADAEVSDNFRPLQPQQPTPPLPCDQVTSLTRHQASSVFSLGREDPTLRRAVFVEGSSCVSELPGHTRSPYKHRRHTEVVLPMTLATSVFINRISSRPRTKIGIVVIVDAISGGSASLFVQTLRRRRVGAVFFQQQASSDVMEHLDAAHIFYFERLGKARVDKLTRDLGTILFHSHTEFIFTIETSPVSLPVVKLNVRCNGGDVVLVLKSREARPVIFVPTENPELLGVEVPLLFDSGEKPHLSNYHEGQSIVALSTVDRTFTAHLLVYMCCYFRQLIASTVTDADLGRVANALLTDATGNHFFQELSYLLRLMA